MLFLEALGGNEVDERLAHGDAAHLADPLVVPVAQPPHRLCREAPRLAAAQQDRQDAARVHLSLEPLGDVGGAAVIHFTLPLIYIWVQPLSLHPAALASVPYGVVLVRVLVPCRYYIFGFI